MKRHAVFTVACLSSLITVGLSLPSSASTKPFSKQSASKILTVSAAAVEAEGSTRVTSLETFSNGTNWSSVLDSAPHTSTQTGHGSGGRELVLVIGSQVFIYGNETYYLSATGLEKAKYVDRWVELTSTSSLYHSNQSGELLKSLAQSVFQLSNSKNDGLVKYRGHEVIKISGQLPTSSAAPGSPQTVYISDVAPYLPVAYTLRVSSDDEAIKATATFSKWGEKVSVAAPTTFITAS